MSYVNLGFGVKFLMDNEFVVTTAGRLILNEMLPDDFPYLNEVINEIAEIGSIQEVAEGELGMKIQKSGRTTEWTTGEIEQVDVTVKVSYGENKTALFVDQLMAGNMSAGGDSGSAVLNMNSEIVGLLFAGSSTSTVINRIQNVFSALNVDIIRY